MSKYNFLFEFNYRVFLFELSYNDIVYSFSVIFLSFRILNSVSYFDFYFNGFDF